MIMLIIGIDGGAGSDFDVHDGIDSGLDVSDEIGDGHSDINVPLNFKLITFRNIIVFFTIFSWAGIVGVKNNYGTIGTLAFAVILGAVVVIILSAVYYLLLKATESGTMDIKNSIGAEGNVYLSIPKNGEGVGQVQVIIQGSLRDLEAISLESRIETGKKVKVVGITNEGKLIVEEIKQTKQIKEGEI